MFQLIYKSEEKFDNSARFLLTHASRYKVYVTTLDVYNPIAQEFSLYNQIKEWKTEDDSLPTREYAIFIANDGSELLLWYDETRKYRDINQKSANCSITPKQISLYKKAFQSIKHAYGVRRFEVSNNGIQNFESLRKGLYPPNESKNKQLTPKKFLEELQKIRNRLIKLQSKSEIIKVGLDIVREKLNSQTAAIFLCDKDGLYYRANIVGTDWHGKEIKQNEWFEDEKYKPGDSFTGKAISPQEDGYGSPQISNTLEEFALDSKSVREYRGKLGIINCAMAVPLNGQNKTFGVFQVINKLDPETKKPQSFCGFDPQEINYLSNIGSFIATAISNYRRYRQSNLYADLASMIAQPPERDENVYNKIAERLVSDETAFKACIIRIKNNNLYEIKGFYSKELNDNRRKNNDVGLNTG
ncbi:MAG: GAF domain-containing protein [Cyanobacteria bacterium P01_G01_bin.39]